MRFFVALLLFLVSYPTAWAGEAHHTTAALISPVASVGDSATVPVAVRITLERGWKTYWRTPGESGLAPAFDWTGSQNFGSATVKWPAPHRFSAYDLDNFVYKDDVVFPIDITPTDIGKPLSLKLKLDLLVCSDICLPETWVLALDLPAGTTVESADKKIYDASLRTLPEAESDSFKFKAAWLTYDSSNINYLAVEAYSAAPLARDADLFIEQGAGLNFGRPRVEYDKKQGKVIFNAPIHDTDTLEAIASKLSTNALALTYVGDGKAVEGTLALSPPPADAKMPLKAQRSLIVPEINLLYIAAVAFLGGLILNLMPCVLPVLSLKILSVVSHGGKDSRRAIARNFGASAAGIVFSFWILAGFLGVLKSAGQAIGWGIQFQHPAFLIFLIISLLLFAVNLWGVFEIPLPRFIARSIPAKHEHEPTLLGHFLSGAFATLLATPCTAPFLGTAVGFALAQNTLGIFLVFTMIGLGLAFPYLLLAVSPRLFRRMPKPGAWMVTLKKVMALALGLTAVWLITVLFSVSFTPALDDGWQPFDEAMIAPAIAEGKIVVVDVTADWCLTCKANKKFVLEQDDIVDALSGPEILLLQADWTRRDEKISAYLQRHGRYGIPFDVVYGPNKPDGILLPELLSKKAITDALTDAAGE